jgi:hypothetical protein
MTSQPTAIADLDIVFDDTEWANLDVPAKHGPAAYNSGRMDTGHVDASSWENRLRQANFASRPAEQVDRICSREIEHLQIKNMNSRIHIDRPDSCG